MTHPSRRQEHERDKSTSRVRVLTLTMAQRTEDSQKSPHPPQAWRPLPSFTNRFAAHQAIALQRPSQTRSSLFQPSEAATLHHDFELQSLLGLHESGSRRQRSLIINIIKDTQDGKHFRVKYEDGEKEDYTLETA